MIYLLEGPDGTGKSTLAKLLIDFSFRAKKSCMYYHCTSTSQSTSLSVEKAYKIFLKDLKKWRAFDYDVVIDRAWVSNIVYTQVYDPGKKHVSDKLSKKLFDAVDKAIICLPKNKEEYLKRFYELAQQRDEAYVDRMDKIYDKFNAFAESYIRYDMTKHLTDDVTTIKIEEIND